MTQHKQTRRQNLEQERGRQAWENIQAIQQKEQSLRKEYRSLARGLNAMIQINGLGQTLGFLKAKGKNENKAHFLLLAHLTNWMRVPGHFNTGDSVAIDNRPDGLLKWVVDAETGSADYRRATAECLAFGNWLRRFAEAELEEPDGEKTHE